MLPILHALIVLGSTEKGLPSPSTSSLPSAGIMICTVGIWMYIRTCCIDLKFSLYEFK